MMLATAGDAEESIARLKQIGGIARYLNKGLTPEFGDELGIATLEYRGKRRQGCTSVCRWSS
jgi:hypothetical protein